MEEANLQVELYHRKEQLYDGELDSFQSHLERKREIVNRLEHLQEEGKIGGFDTKPCQGGTPVERRSTRGGIRKWGTERYDAYSRWATQQGLTLQPHFQETDTRISFPPLYLVVQKGSGLDVKAVFPCSDGDTEYNIEDYLTAKEEGRDWRTEGRQSSVPDYGVHGSIKAHVRKHSDELLGDQWVWESDEYPVHRGHGPLEEEGRIDIVFRHGAKTKFLLVEVKPTESEVDKAFGQLLRYKHQFLNHREIPGLSPENVELAIASMGFYESHRRAAKDVGIRLVEVGNE